MLCHPTRPGFAPSQFHAKVAELRECLCQAIADSQRDHTVIEQLAASDRAHCRKLNEERTAHAKTLEELAKMAEANVHLREELFKSMRERLTLWQMLAAQEEEHHAVLVELRSLFQQSPQ